MVLRREIQAGKFASKPAARGTLWLTQTPALSLWKGEVGLSDWLRVETRDGKVLELGSARRIPQRCTSAADARVHLVERAVGFDPRGSLGDTGAAEQAGRAVVAGPRVDFHGSAIRSLRVR